MSNRRSAKCRWMKWLSKKLHSANRQDTRIVGEEGGGPGMCDAMRKERRGEGKREVRERKEKEKEGKAGKG